MLLLILPVKKSIAAHFTKDLIISAQLRALKNSHLIYRSSKLSKSTDVFILSDEHTKDHPKLERVICPSLHHPAFASLIRSPKLLDIVEDLVCRVFSVM